MQSSIVFDFSNIISSSFVGSTTTYEPFITFMDIYHMNDIWRVSGSLQIAHILFLAIETNDSLHDNFFKVYARYLPEQFLPGYWS